MSSQKKPHELLPSWELNKSLFPDDWIAMHDSVEDEDGKHVVCAYPIGSVKPDKCCCDGIGCPVAVQETEALQQKIIEADERTYSCHVCGVTIPPCDDLRIEFDEDDNVLFRHAGKCNE